MNTRQIFYNTYNLVQDFLEAMDAKNIDKVRAVISPTDNIGPQLATILNTFRKNLTAVLNSLGFAYSNGCLEATKPQSQINSKNSLWIKNMLIRIKLESKNIAISEIRPSFAA